MNRHDLRSERTLARPDLRRRERPLRRVFDRFTGETLEEHLDCHHRNPFPEPRPAGERDTDNDRLFEFALGGAGDNR